MSDEAGNAHRMQWGRTTIAWTPEGYVTTITIFLDARESDYFVNNLEDALSKVRGLPEARKTKFTSGWVERDESGVRSEPAILELTTGREIFNVNPGELRIAIGNLTNHAVIDAEGQQAKDEVDAERWLTALKHAG